MSKVSLKAQNVVPLSTLTLFVLALAHIVTKGEVGAELFTSLVPAASALTISGVVGVWLSYVIPAEAKHTLVFLRFRHALPGNRFLELSRRDARIDFELLSQTIDGVEELKTCAKKQNSYWYREIYRRVINETAVVSIHKSFLLYRDLASVAFLCLLLFGLGGQVIPGLSGIIGGRGLGVILLSMILFCMAANSSGKRFVTSTVSLYLSKKGLP